MKKKPAPPWTPFERRNLTPYTEKDIQNILTAFPLMTREGAIKAFEHVRNDTVFVNSRYQVNVRKYQDLIHLSIKRLDKQRIGPERYRDFMRIKADLVNAECEAVELYPAASREMDTVNQYHLWCLADPAQRFPFGFDVGRHVTGTAGLGNAVQHPFDEDHHK